MTESHTQRLIMDWLKAKGILAFRMNSGAMAGEYKGKKRFLRFGVPGMADILAFIPQRFDSISGTITAPWPTWIEVKAPNGKQTELQKSFQAQVLYDGHHYILAKSLEDLLKIMGYQ